MMGDGLTWNRYLTENVPDGDDVDIVQDGYIKNGEFYKNNPGDGIRVGKYIQKESVSSIKKVRYAEYSKLFPYGDAPIPPSSPLSDSLQVDLELELLGSRNTNDLNQFWDSSGNDRHATATNGFTVNSGLKGNALYGEVATNQRLYLGGSSVTWRAVSCWVYNSIASSGSTNGAMQIVWNFGTTRVELNICTMGALDGPIYLIKKGGVVRAVGSPITKPLGWHHIVFVRTEARPFWAIWIDGVASAVEDYRSALEWSIPYNSSSLIGYQTNTYMDLVRGWSRALSAAEVAELYNDGDGI